MKNFYWISRTDAGEQQKKIYNKRVQYFFPVLFVVYVFRAVKQIIYKQNNLPSLK